MLLVLLQFSFPVKIIVLEKFQELRVTRTSSRISRTAGLDDVDYVSQHSPRHLNTKWQSGGHQQNNYKSNTESSLLQPLVMQFTVVLQVFLSLCNVRL